MVVALIERLGGVLLSAFSSSVKIYRFISLIVFHLFLPSTYHPAMVGVLVRQIFFTVVEILPFFLLIGLFFGSIGIGSMIETANEYGLRDKIIPILVKFTFYEFAPLFSTILIALRSGAAINSEIALMKASNEINTLEKFKIDPVDYLYVPRVIGGMLSTITLSFLLTIFMLLGGYFFVYLSLGINLDTYLHTLSIHITLYHFLILFLKSITLGFLVVVIAIYSGLGATNALYTVPISVFRGMVRVFIAIIYVEGVSLLIR